MRPYLAVLRSRFLAQLQYRAAALAGLATQVFWGFLRLMILTAFYRMATGPQPMSLVETATYIWLGQGLLRILPFRAEPEAEEAIRTGNVAYDLLRPMDLYGYWYARSLSFSTAPTVLRSVPLLALALLFFGMQPPASVAAGAAFLVALGLAVMLSASMLTLISVTNLWTLSGNGLATILAVLSWVGSGITLPLPLFPDWAQPLLMAQPFRGLMDTPFRLWMGNLPLSEAPAAFAHQVFWILTLVTFSRWLLGRATRRLVVQGG